MKFSSGGSAASSLYKTVSPGDSVSIHLANSGFINGTTIPVVLKTYKYWYELYGYSTSHTAPVPQTAPPTWNWSGTYTYWWTFHSETTYRVYSFEVRRGTCSVTSFDTRKVYGQPDIEGSYPGDANAEARNPTFNPWIHKGGVFVGNMPTSGSDGSGIARTQIVANHAATSNTVWATLTTMYLGKPTTATNNVSIKAFTPASGDTNYSVAATSMTWTNKWSDTGGTAGETVAFGSSTPAVNDFCNWRFYLTSGATAKVGLMSTDESPTTSSPAWRYFGSPAYQDITVVSPGTWPLNDCRPRTWLLDQTYTSWTE